MMIFCIIQSLVNKAGFIYVIQSMQLAKQGKFDQEENSETP